MDVFRAQKFVLNFFFLFLKVSIKSELTNSMTAQQSAPSHISLFLTTSPQSQHQQQQPQQHLPFTIPLYLQQQQQLDNSTTNASNTSFLLASTPGSAQSNSNHLLELTTTNAQLAFTTYAATTLQNLKHFINNNQSFMATTAQQQLQLQPVQSNTSHNDSNILSDAESVSNDSTTSLMGGYSASISSQDSGVSDLKQNNTNATQSMDTSICSSASSMSSSQPIKDKLQHQQKIKKVLKRKSSKIQMLLSEQQTHEPQSKKFKSRLHIQTPPNSTIHSSDDNDYTFNNTNKHLHVQEKEALRNRRLKRHFYDDENANFRLLVDVAVSLLEKQQEFRN
jgi:hypothetical protein